MAGCSNESGRLDPRWAEAIHQAFHRLERRWVLPIPSEQPEFHVYDPLPVAEFLPAIETASKATAGRRFLDVGCGIGTKLALMLALGWQVAGIELRRRYVLAASELVPEASVVCADLRDVAEFDADLVYCYRPARADELETEIERYVVDRVRPSTLLFFPTRDLPDAWGLTRLDRHLWRR